MDRVKGKNSIFYIRYDSDWMPISCETNNSMQEEVDMIGTTTRDNKGWNTELPTKQSYSIDVSAQVIDEEGGKLSLFKIKQIKRDRQRIEWRRKTMDGNYIESGQAYITEISDETPADDLMTFEMTLIGFGKPKVNSETAELSLLAHNSDLDKEFVRYK